MTVNENTGSEVLWSYGQVVLPVNTEAQSYAYGRWVVTGGQQGKKPEDAKLLKGLELFASAPGLKLEERNKVAQEIWKLAVDEVWNIGLIGMAPAAYGVRVVKNNVGNVPSRQSTIRDARIPGGSHPATFFFKG